MPAVGGSNNVSRCQKGSFKPKHATALAFIASILENVLPVPRQRADPLRSARHPYTLGQRWVHDVLVDHQLIIRSGLRSQFRSR